MAHWFPPPIGEDAELELGAADDEETATLLDGA